MTSDSRLLSLLGLFASGRTFTAAELSEQFGVTARTIRRDIAGLRELGYIISSVPGAAGGYRAESRTLLPPLQFEAGEALSTALGLALLRGAGLSTADASSATAKIRGMLPAAMRETVGAIGTTVSVLPGHEPEVDHAAVVTAASAIASRVLLTFTYTKMRARARSRSDETSTREHSGADHGERALRERRVEPVRLVVLGAHWYLYAWDLGRGDWRVFRLDRMHEVHATTFGFPPRDHPDAEAAVRAAVTSAAYPHRVVLRVAAAPAEAQRWFPSRAVTITEADGGCLIEFGVESFDWAAASAAQIPIDFRVVDPPEMVDAVARLRDRMAGVVEHH